MDVIIPLIVAAINLLIFGTVVFSILKSVSQVAKQRGNLTRPRSLTPGAESNEPESEAPAGYDVLAEALKRFQERQGIELATHADEEPAWEFEESQSAAPAKEAGSSSYSSAHEMDTHSSRYKSAREVVGMGDVSPLPAAPTPIAKKLHETRTTKKRLPLEFSGDAVVRALIMSEILGPPKALGRERRF